ncbi:MAG: host attachment protein [Cyanobacteria bacterium P01_F01_bin.116]
MGFEPSMPTQDDLFMICIMVIYGMNLKLLYPGDVVPWEGSSARQIIVIAAPQILGLMRDVFTPLLPKQLKINELARDLCHFKPHELHDYLTKTGKLPARNRL